MAQLVHVQQHYSNAIKRKLIVIEFDDFSVVVEWRPPLSHHPLIRSFDPGSMASSSSSPFSILLLLLFLYSFYYFFFIPPFKSWFFHFCLNRSTSEKKKNFLPEFNTINLRWKTTKRCNFDLVNILSLIHFQLIYSPSHYNVEKWIFMLRLYLRLFKNWYFNDGNQSF